MRRGFAYVVALLTLAAACSSEPLPSAPPEEPADAFESPASTPAATSSQPLVIWAGPDVADRLGPIAERFGAEKSTTVQVKEIRQDMLRTFLTASRRGDGPDIVIGAHRWIGDLVRHRAIEPVTLTQEQIWAFDDKALRAVTYDGAVYGVPYAMENVALIMNTQLIRGYPATIEDVVKHGRALKAAGDVEEVLCLPVGRQVDAVPVMPIFTAAGGELFDPHSMDRPSPRTRLGSARSIKAFETLKQLGETGSGALRTSNTSGNSIARFSAGKCAFLIAGPRAMPQIKQSAVGHFITAVPRFENYEDGTYEARPWIDVEAFYVASAGKNRSLARAFVSAYGTDMDVAMAMVEGDPRHPALTAELERVALDNPYATNFMDAGRHGEPAPASPKMAEISEAFGIAEATVVRGGDATAAATTAQRTVENLFRR